MQALILVVFKVLMPFFKLTFADLLLPNFNPKSMICYVLTFEYRLKAVIRHTTVCYVGCFLVILCPRKHFELCRSVLLYVVKSH